MRGFFYYYLFPVPYSLFPLPSSLKPIIFSLMRKDNCYRQIINP
ncbi:hypothetical protein [Moorena producens]